MKRSGEGTDPAAFGLLDSPESEPHERFNVGKLNFAVLAKSDERYQTITFGPLEFKDSFKFREKSLDSLVQARKGDFTRDGVADLQAAFPLLARLHPHRDKLELLASKFKMPFGAMTDATVFSRPPVLELEA